MSLRLFLFASVLLGGSIFAHADTMFDLSANLVDGTVSGTFSIDNLGGVRNPALTLTTSLGTYTFTTSTQGYFGQQGTINGPYAINFEDNTDGGILYIYLPGVSNLKGYTGPSGLCVQNNQNGCLDSHGTYIKSVFVPPGITNTSQVDQVTSGSITAEGVSPVPEPSSVALVGTGLLGLAWLGQRKYLSGGYKAGLQTVN